MLCPDCNVFYTCRLCHDAESSHSMDRYKVEVMACMHCLHIQVGKVIFLNCRKLLNHVLFAINSLASITVTFAIYGKI